MSESDSQAGRTWDFTVVNTRGLHLRFAGEIAKHAMKYKASVRISDDHHSADAKSALALLSLAAPVGSHLVLESTGEQAEEAMLDLKNFIESYKEL